MYTTYKLHSSLHSSAVKFLKAMHHCPIYDKDCRPYNNVISNPSVLCSNRLLLKNAYDPWLYQELNLQPFWNTVSYCCVCVCGVCV